MKRFLSGIIAIVMIAATLPSVAFAIGGELEYVFNYGVFGLTYSTSNNEYPYTTSKGVAPDAYSEKFDLEKSDPWSYVAAVNNHTTAIRKDGSLYVTHKKGVDYKELGANATVFKISVENPGSYKVAINTYKAPLAAKTNVYLVDSDYAEANDFVFTNANGIKKVFADEATMYVGYMDSYDASGEPWKAANNVSVEMDTVDLEKKEYYVIFSIDGPNSKIYAAEQSENVNAVENYYYYVRSIALTRQPYVSVSVADNEIENGEKTTLSSVAKLGDDTDAGVDVAYTVAPEGVVSVEADGTVKTLAEGTATITAKATIGGVEYSDSVEIKVNPTTHYYEFTSTALGYDTSVGFGAATTTHKGEYSTREGAYADSNKWMLGGTRSAYAGGIYPSTSNYLYFSVSDSEIRDNNSGVSLKINVPEGETKTYKPKIEYVDSLTYGMTADFYVVECAESGYYSDNYLVATETNGRKTSIATVSADLKANGADKKIATITAYPDSADTYNNIELDPGDYWLIIVPTGGSRAPSSGKYHFKVKSLTLTETTEPRQNGAYVDAFNVTKETYASAPLTSATVNTFTAYLGETKDTSSAEVTSATATLGNQFTVTANEIEGYKFLYWAKGMSTARKQIVSYSEEYTFVPTVENTYLIAVYEPIEASDEAAKAEFYNGNGQLIATLVEDGNSPALPEMAGYGVATGWKLYGTEEIIAGGTTVTVSGTKIYVAQYDDLSESYTVTVTGGTGSGSYKYGEVVTCTPSGEGTFIGWKKDGKIVSAASTYSFRAWESCSVEALYGDSTPVFSGKKMKIIIDTLTAGAKNAVMAEFIGMDDAVEKGISFGTKRIAMSTNKNQFTVVNDESVGEVYGYAIFKDGTIVYDR